MNLEQAIQILRAAGRPTCSCKYGGSTDNMIQEAIKIQQAQQFLLFTIACLLVSFSLSNFIISILCCFMSGSLIRIAVSNFKKTE